MKLYPESALRRAMKVVEVMLKAIGKEIKWIQAADILGVTPRTIRRMRAVYQEQGIDGLTDRRRGRPSARRAPYELVEKVLCLYHEQYFDFNVRHFHEHLVSRHGLSCSYTWVKNLLQEAGYVKHRQGRGGHRKRRERRPLFGQMLHLDGSEHQWLALRPGERQVLLLVVDDATGRIWRPGWWRPRLPKRAWASCGKWWKATAFRRSSTPTGTVFIGIRPRPAARWTGNDSRSSAGPWRSWGWR